MTKRKIFDMGKNYDAIKAGTPVIVPVKYVSLEELRALYPPGDVPRTPEWPGIDIKVSSEPYILDDAVRQQRLSRLSELWDRIKIYDGEEWNSDQVQMLHDAYTTGLSINRIIPKRFFKSEVSWLCCWPCCRWRLNLIAGRIRDAWLVLIGKREI